MALIAIVDPSGDVRTFDTDEDGVMIVAAFSMSELKRMMDRLVFKHERARDNVLETNSDLHVFASAKLDTADADSAYRKKQYKARDTLANRKNFRAYMGEELRSPSGEQGRSEVLPVGKNLILPDRPL
jgi:hypothetical protein